MWGGIIAILCVVASTAAKRDAQQVVVRSFDCGLVPGMGFADLAGAALEAIGHFFFFFCVCFIDVACTEKGALLAPFSW